MSVKRRKPKIGLEELKSYHSLKREITAQIKRLEELERQAERGGQWSFDGLKRTRTDKERLIGLINKKKGLVESNLVTLEMQASEIEEAVQGLEDPLHRELIRMRYCDDMDWSRISHKLGYVSRQCLRLHNQALQLLEHTHSVDDGKPER